jgi:hypothetical protein
MVFNKSGAFLYNFSPGEKIIDDGSTVFGDDLVSHIGTRKNKITA